MKKWPGGKHSAYGLSLGAYGPQRSLLASQRITDHNRENQNTKAPPAAEDAAQTADHALQTPGSGPERAQPGGQPRGWFHAAPHARRAPAPQLALCGPGCLPSPGWFPPSPSLQPLGCYLGGSWQHPQGYAPVPERRTLSLLWGPALQFLCQICCVANL